MAENNATCSICGIPYQICNSCKDSMSTHPWRIHTDTSEHYKVFQVVRGFSTGVYNKEEARKKFKNVDLSDLDSFRPHIKELIKDILKEDKKVVNKPIVSRKRDNKINEVKKVEIKVDDKVETDISVNS